MNGVKSTPAQRWLARLSFVLAGLAIVVLPVFAGLKSLATMAVGLTARLTLAGSQANWRMPEHPAQPSARYPYLIAAEHGIPFVVTSAGTRNHFALDLGPDREDPSAGLGALSDGVELRVDLGLIDGQTFVNNASFGAYAEVVPRGHFGN
jgi:hypothetical protein